MHDRPEQASASRPAEQSRPSEPGRDVDGAAKVRATPATFMYMNESVGVAELRQNLSVYLRRVSRGERLVVTDRNRPVAELGPVPTTGPDLDRLIAEGRVSPPLRRGLPEPLELTGDPRALSRALDDIRGDR
jgi:prevent-host-death family protein